MCRNAVAASCVPWFRYDLARDIYYITVTMDRRRKKEKDGDVWKKYIVENSSEQEQVAICNEKRLTGVDTQ